jgi:hypothetical protein
LTHACEGEAKSSQFILLDGWTASRDRPAANAPTPPAPQPRAGRSGYAAKLTFEIGGDGLARPSATPSGTREREKLFLACEVVRHSLQVRTTDNQDEMETAAIEQLHRLRA